MPECPICGRENADDARFCSQCGAALAQPEPSRESRKVVTVLFCDVVGSTALGEATDPEAVRARMRRYFEDLRAVIERHGGSVEKFVGDAVMAVFGIPVSHEDDALRAVRAAAEMRVAMSDHGLEARIGINTGEVVVGGEGETLATGDAVNVAARLEQAAPPGEALIGAETRRLVRDAVVVEAVEPVALKGKSEPVQAYRLLEVFENVDAVARHPEAPLVGRARERERLRRDFEDAVADRTCRLFTLLGPAGIGKSRLVADFLQRAAGEADFLRGRCLHYGEDITYWPLVEMLIEIGVDPADVIGTSPEETRLAFRRLLEARAAERPQVVVIDDLQWAEPTFVDLVEHVADLSRGAPIFLLCVARTELLDSRAGWGGGKLNATSVLLEPLGGDDCAALIENLLGDADLDGTARDRIANASGGNPLFVEEMLAMVREHGADDELVVPSTIQMLLQARLDQLGFDERVVIERGAVEGQMFHRGSLQELAPESVRVELESHLSTLVRKDLIRPDRPTFPGDDAFRFRHLLIRDAAYDSLPKASRAELHERFAGWLGQHAFVERDEILGYHLEQAHRYRAELDASDEALPGLAVRAADHLTTAGQNALEHGDYQAGSGLLRRAAAVLPLDDDRRFALIPDLCLALWESGHRTKAQMVLVEGRAAKDPVVRAIVDILETLFEQVDRRGASTADERQARTERARAILEAAGHDEGLSIYWASVARERWLRCLHAESAAAVEQALFYSERAGARRRAQLIQHSLLGNYVFGPVPVAEGIERVEAIRAAAAAEGAILLEAGAVATLGRLLVMRGEVESGRELARRGRQTLREAGMSTAAAGMVLSDAWIEQIAGDLSAWETVLRSGLEEIEQVGDPGYYATAVAYLAMCLYLQGRLEEADELCAVARDSTSPDDLINFVYLDNVEGGLLAHRGQYREAEAQARRAIELADATDEYVLRGDSRVFLAEVLGMSDRTEEATAVASEGLALYLEKGDVTGAARLRERMRDLDIRVAA